MKFEVYGPFEITRKNGLVSRDRNDKRDFWNQVEKATNGLSEACGCYVLEIHGIVRYIGLTEKQAFKQECFQHHKINLYNEALQQTTGSPYLYFIAKLTNTGKFSKPSIRGCDYIQFLEKMLIGIGYDRNPDILNMRDTAILRDIIVPGILNTLPGTAKSTSVQCLKQALGL